MNVTTARPYTLFRCTRTLLTYQTANAAGFKVWIPLLDVYHKDKRTREKVKTTAAAIPGYLFSYRTEAEELIDWAGRLPAIRVGLCLRPDGRPVRISVAELEGVRDACDELNKRRKPATPKFKLGDRVLVTVGPLEGMEGFIDGLREHTARVLIGTKYVGLPLPFVRKL